MLKKYASLAVLFILIFSTPLKPLKASVPENIDLEEAVYFLNQKGVLEKTYDQIDFNALMTKKEFIKMLLSALEFKPDSQSLKEKKCGDIADGSEFIPYLNRAVELGAIHPVASNNSCWSNTGLTKFSALRLIFEIGGIPTPKIFSFEKKPRDVRLNGWFAPTIDRALDTKILVADKNNRVKPHARLTWQDGIELIYRSLLYISPDIRKEVNFLEFQEEINRGGIKIKGQVGNDLLIQNIDIENIELLLTVLDKIANQYYFREQDKITKETIVYETIHALLEKLSDPHTEFKEPETTSIKELLGGKFQGIGVQIEEHHNEIIIVHVVRDSPAAKAGLKAKDRIRKIDGSEIFGLSLEEIAKKIRGEKGTLVQLLIYRPEIAQELSFDITRAEIIYSGLEYELLPDNIGYIAINVFGDNIDTEFGAAFKELLASGMKKLIVDVRGNPGGYYDITLNILDHFLSDEKVLNNIKLLDRILPQYSPGIQPDSDIPLAVLINESSASASEIFAAAIQDHKRGKIIGTTSFGKGTVQEVDFFSNDAIFKVTIAEWLTPKEKPINKLGITPDIVAEQSKYPDEDLPLKKAVEILSQMVYN